MRGVAWLDDFRRDASYAARGLLRARGFAVTATLTLALGIGANTTAFSLLHALLLRPLPVTDPEQLVILTDPNVGGAAGGLILGERDHVSYDEFEALRAGMTSFSGMFAAQAFIDTWNARINGQAAERVRTKFVSGDFFDVLGVHAVLGRTFTADDEQGPGSAPYAVVSYAYWQRRFGGARSVLGSRIRIADADLEIIGVASAEFLGESVGEAPDVWMPVVMQRMAMPGVNWLASSNMMWLHAIGRLKTGTSLAQAQAEADLVFGAMLRLRSAQFASNPDLAANVLKQHLLLRDATRGVSALRGASDAAAHPDGIRRARARDRVRQCRDPPAGSRLHATQGNGHPTCGRRQSLADRAAARDREHRARADCRSGRERVRLRRCAPARGGGA